MTLATFYVQFRGELPDNAWVGQRLDVRGAVTIRRIGADLVDVTLLGHDPEWPPGELNVDLYANRLDVSKGEVDKPSPTIEAETRGG